MRPADGGFMIRVMAVLANLWSVDMMDPATSPRSLKHLVLPLLVLSFAICGLTAVARASDPVTATWAQDAMTPATRRACDEGAGVTCRAPATMRHAVEVEPQSRAPTSSVGVVPPAGSDSSSAQRIELQLQQGLFTRGGRLAPVDVFADGPRREVARERTAKAPDWAVQLRAARNELEKERS
jgi:hypothetical protein